MIGSATNQSVKRQTKSLVPFEGRVHLAITPIAESDCPVLIVGERGVGKRSVAARIHELSSRSRCVYREFHCSDLDTETLKSALAIRGTLHLVEISELGLSLQELLIDTYFHDPAPAPCRLICSSTRELQDEIKSWRIREDFYYLISAVTLRLAPLRCRKAEILSIADELLTQYARQFDRPKPVLGEEIIGFLLEHTWPDNLSELETAIKTFVAIGDQSISLAALKASAPGVKSNGHRNSLSLKDAARTATIQVERQLISEVLSSTGGNRKRAADQLGISYKALLYKIKQIGSQSQPASNGNGVAV
jgi:DNA-binding NtrC family response regulator